MAPESHAERDGFKGGISGPGSSDPREGVEGTLDIGAGHLATLGGGGEFEGTLEQAIKQAWRTLRTLEEEFLGRGFEGRSVDADLG